jgi:hypothetical protein
MVMADGLIAGLARVIVAHRRIARRGGDGRKTLLDKPGLLLTERKLLRLRVQLGERFPAASRRGTSRLSQARKLTHAAPSW